MALNLNVARSAMDQDSYDFLFCPTIRNMQDVNISSTDMDLTATGANWYFPAARRVYVGVGGDVIVKGVDGVAHTYKNVPSGGYVDGPITAVVKVNTTATNMVAEQ